MLLLHLDLTKLAVTWARDNKYKSRLLIPLLHLLLDQACILMPPKQQRQLMNAEILCSSCFHTLRGLRSTLLCYLWGSICIQTGWRQTGISCGCCFGCSNYIRTLTKLAFNCALLVVGLHFSLIAIGRWDSRVMFPTVTA